MGKEERLCLSSSGVVGSECSSPLWIHVFSLPGFCQKSFGFESEPLTIVFPVYYNGGLRRFCIILRGDTIETYSGRQLRPLVTETMKLIGSRGKLGLLTVLNTLFRTLLSLYHEELSKADHEIEDIINRVMGGEQLYKPILRLYNHLSRLHRGVHGLIYSLHKLTRVHDELNYLVDEAVMLENMYSTSIDRVTQAFSLYYTLVGERTNRVVTKLTVISAIFLPLTLIAGIYGMNFKYMPELQYPLAYPLTLLGMLVIAVSEIIYFKRKKWI
jgi:magnesium transporter